MRLINTKTYELREFVWSMRDRPAYAILSHRWSDDEISFAQYTDSRYMKKHGHYSNGWKKIKRFCDLVAERESDEKTKLVEWVWIDTCCIDKSSSAELSEAINSMFNWYRCAERCYAYLFDVHEAHNIDAFKESKWFDRGWTLQELLAPEHVEFFSSSWEIIGTKRTLCREISSTTRIPVPLLQDPDSYFIEWISVAERMSWAARRFTTREEDEAYCLLGIFGVNMPLLYGEGSFKAFHRLQLEILGRTDDDSIFAWDVHYSPGTKTLRPKVRRGHHMPRKLLAGRPKDFIHSGNIKRMQLRDVEPQPWFQNNIGLSMHRLLFSLKENFDLLVHSLSQALEQSKSPDDYLATKMIMPIECEHWDGHGISKLALGLAPADPNNTNNIFAVTNLYEHCGILKEGRTTDFIIAWRPGDYVQPQLYDKLKNPKLLLDELQDEILRHILNYPTAEMILDTKLSTNSTIRLLFQADNAQLSHESVQRVPFFSVYVSRTQHSFAFVSLQRWLDGEFINLQKFLSDLMLPSGKVEEFVSKACVACRLATDRYMSLLEEKRHSNHDELLRHATGDLWLKF